MLLDAAGLTQSPLLVAIILTATSLGIVVPVLKDADAIETGDWAAGRGGGVDRRLRGDRIAVTVLLAGGDGAGTKLVLLGEPRDLAVAIGVVVAGAERWSRLTAVFARLQDTTAQIRVRGAFVLLVGFAALAEHLGLEVILGAFIAGAVLTIVDRDLAMTHPQFRLKLEAIGYGIFVPVFFVTSGVRFDLDALLAARPLSREFRSSSVHS